MFHFAYAFHLQIVQSQHHFVFEVLESETIILFRKIKRLGKHTVVPKCNSRLDANSLKASILNLDKWFLSFVQDKNANKEMPNFSW